VLAFARIGLGLAGLLCLAIAAIFDLEFVGRHVAADGAVTPAQAAALPAARLALAGLGLLVLAIGAFLERILAAPWLDRFLGSRRRIEWTIFLAPLVILIALAGYKLVRGPGDPFYLLAVREDSLVESPASSHPACWSGRCTWHAALSCRLTTRCWLCSVCSSGWRRSATGKG
jgi:hypothetical protein